MNVGDFIIWNGRYTPRKIIHISSAGDYVWFIKDRSSGCSMEFLISRDVRLATHLEIQRYIDMRLEEVQDGIAASMKRTMSEDY